ncbi:hypothetical protein P7C70_g2856, partial [Phenoliferia sp. Uapishka_3]
MVLSFLLHGITLISIYSAYGVLQEKVIKTPYGSNAEHFESYSLLIFSNRLFASTLAIVILAWNNRAQRNTPLRRLSPTSPLQHFALIAGFSFISSTCQLHALSFVSFTTAALAKTAMIPLVVVGGLMYKRRLDARDWAAALVVTLGSVTFLTKSVGEVAALDDADDAYFDGVVGALYLAGYLFFDGLTSESQEAYFGMSTSLVDPFGEGSSVLPQMIFVNAFTCLYSLGGLSIDIISGTFAPSLRLLIASSALQRDVLLLSTTSSLGSVILLNTMTSLGAPSAKFLMTVRQFFGIALNAGAFLEDVCTASADEDELTRCDAGIFRHFLSVGLQGWLGVGWVAAGAWINMIWSADDDVEVTTLSSTEEGSLSEKEDFAARVAFPSSPRSISPSSSILYISPPPSPSPPYHPLEPLQRSASPAWHIKHFVVPITLPVVLAILLLFIYPELGAKIEQPESNSGSIHYISHTNKGEGQGDQFIAVEGGEWERELVDAIWPDCNATETQRWPGSIRTALASFPRSGNTFTRELVERSSNWQTSTVGYCDQSLALTFHGECDVEANLLVKTHYPEHTTEQDPGYIVEQKFDQALYLVRNPVRPFHNFLRERPADKIVKKIDALFSGWQMAHVPKTSEGTLDHAGRLAIDILGASAAERADVMSRAEKYLHHFEFWRDVKVPKVLVYYEDLMSKRLPTLMTVLAFLLPADGLPSLTSIACAMELDESKEAYKPLTVARKTRRSGKPPVTLHNLPPEILEQIWELAPDCQKPISKALLFLTQANLYRHLSILSFPRFQQLSAYLPPSNLASSVRCVVLANLEATNPGEADREIRVRQIKEFLELFSNVSSLKITATATSGIVDLVLKEDFARNTLQKLSSLDLLWEDDDQTNPFNLTRFENLSHYPCLQTLHVISDSDPDTLAQLSPILPSPLPPPPIFVLSDVINTTKALNSSITTLKLDGPLTNQAAADFIRYFPTLKALEVVDTSSDSNLKPLLEAVIAPELLRSLAVKAYELDDVEPVDTAFDRFTSLEFTVLHQNTFSDDIFDTLAILPLQVVIFECQEVSLESLEALVAESSTLQSLHLHLGMLEAHIGDTIDNWKLPVWTEEFDVDGARQLLPLAEEYGVEVCEGLTDALDIEDLFWEALHASTRSPTIKEKNILNPSSAERPHDLLSTLPSHLMLLIFEMAEDLTQPISKALLAGTQASQYRHPIIRSHGQLSTFCDALEGRPDVGPLVKSLVFNFSGLCYYHGDDSNDDEDDEADDDVPPGVHPPLERLLRLFAATPHVKSITTFKAKLVLDAILSRTISTRFLKQLEELQVRDSFEGSPWVWGRYRHLSNYQELETLEIRSSYVDYELSGQTDDEATSRANNFGLSRLFLRGYLSESPLPAFIEHFQGLTQLVLWDLSEDQDLTPILESTTSILRSLRIFEDGDANSVTSIDHSLQKFENLDDLLIPDDMIHNCFFRHFITDTLPLTTLDISLGATTGKTKLKASNLRALLNTLPSLETLEISVFPCCMGSKFDDGSGRLYADWNRTLDNFNGWMLPDFGGDFTFKDAKELVRLAEARGVELAGDILEAIEVETAFRQIRRGRPHGRITAS